MSNKSPKGSGRKAGLTRYKTSNSYETNRKRKLARALKRNPENKQIELALQDKGIPRKTPKVPVWSHSSIRIAQLMKQFMGKYNKNILSSDIDAWLVAIKDHKDQFLPKKVIEAKKQGSLFSIGQRVRIVLPS
jgi:hypothetical protein